MNYFLPVLTETTSVFGGLLCRFPRFLLKSMIWKSPASRLIRLCAVMFMLINDSPFLGLLSVSFVCATLVYYCISYMIFENFLFNKTDKKRIVVLFSNIFITWAFQQVGHHLKSWGLLNIFQTFWQPRTVEMHKFHWLKQSDTTWRYFNTAFCACKSEQNCCHGLGASTQR